MKYETLKESSNNQRTKREGLPKGKAPYMKTNGITDFPKSWEAKINYWRKKLMELIGYEVLE